MNPASSWMAFLLSCSLNSSSNRGRSSVATRSRNATKSLAGLDVGVHVRAKLGPAPQDFTHVLDQALAIAAELASEMLDLLGQLVGERRLGLERTVRRGSADSSRGGR